MKVPSGIGDFLELKDQLHNQWNTWYLFSKVQSTTDKPFPLFKEMLGTRAPNS